MLYRDFDGKRELYEAVLEALQRRLAELVGDDPEGGASVRGLAALVGVAREQPDAFVLLFRHAAREPAFAAWADRFLDAGVAWAEERLARELADPVLVRWSARVAVHATIEAVIAWLQVGDPGRDQAFLAALEATQITQGPLTGWPERVAAAVQQRQADT
jgi:AcrR family transcriptional regulator